MKKRLLAYIIVLSLVFCLLTSCELFGQKDKDTNKGPGEIPGPATKPTDARILNPATTSTQLSGGTTYTGTSSGNKSLPNPSPYGYETWDEPGSGGAGSLTWYGASAGGGGAFKAQWTNTKDYLARIGYFWGNGGKYATYGNIYCGFNFTKSGQYKGNFSYIGIYGWSRNPLVEYYIVEDWFGNNWNSPTTPVGADTILSDIPAGNRPNNIKSTNFFVDGGTYIIYMKTRTGPSIDGNQTFTQFFSVRQTPRQSGTISVTEHFKKWQELGMNLGNMYECKFLVEAGGRENETPPPGAGSFDARLIQFYRADNDGNILQITP